MSSETQRTRVKVCGLTRIEDVRAAVSAGVDAVGLVFHPASPRAVEVDQAKALVRALPPFVTSVGLFVDPAPERVRSVCAAVPLDLLQFHGNETPDFCTAFGKPYLKAVRVYPGVDLRSVAAAHANACGLLLDAYVPGLPGGTGERFDWRLIPALELPVVLAGGLGPENVGEAVRNVRPYAVDVSSGVEREKGIKDAAKIAAFIRGVQCADREF